MNECRYYESVKKFMEAAGQFVPDNPCRPDLSVSVTRTRMLREEWNEFVSAQAEFYDATDDDARFDAMVKTIDGVCDIIYVALGALVEMGVPFHPFMQEVCDNNLKKVIPRVHIVDGKVSKPPGFVGPDLAGILKGIIDDAEEAERSHGLDVDGPQGTEGSGERTELENPS